MQPAVQLVSTLYNFIIDSGNLVQNCKVCKHVSREQQLQLVTSPARVVRHYLTVPETLSLKTTCDTIVGGDTIASVVSRSSLCTSPPSSRYTPWLLLKTGRESICSFDNLKCKFCTLWQNITKRDNNYVNCAAIRQSLFTQGGPTKPKNIETKIQIKQNKKVVLLADKVLLPSDEKTAHLPPQPKGLLLSHQTKLLHYHLMR